jgi:Cu2+-containing amine oxidase
MLAEYVWNYFFYQDGSIEFEIRLTGILQVYVAGPNEPTPYSVRVAPGINAQFHQHLFSVRIDPMVDGLANSIVETDVRPVVAGCGSSENFAGNAFQVHDRLLRRASEGERQWDASTDRRWRIVSAGKRHYATGQSTGYSIGVKGAVTPALPRPEGWVGCRATFMRNALWVVREKEDAREGGRMWPSGKFVPQAREEAMDSLGQWVRDDGDANIENEDVLVYVTVGTTHIPRPEDWPVYVFVSLCSSVHAFWRETDTQKWKRKKKLTLTRCIGCPLTTFGSRSSRTASSLPTPVWTFPGGRTRKAYPPPSVLILLPQERTVAPEYGVVRAPGGRNARAFLFVCISSGLARTVSQQEHI